MQLSRHEWTRYRTMNEISFIMGVKWPDIYFTYTLDNSLINLRVANVAILPLTSYIRNCVAQPQMEGSNFI